MTDAKDKLAVVTASAGGIGLVVAKALAAEGWRVAMSDIDPAGEAEAKKIGAKNPDVMPDTFFLTSL